jgi:hypothetical protein
MIRARIYARGEVSFAKFLFLPSWFAKLLEGNFSCFAKLDDAKLICQTVEVALLKKKTLSFENTRWRRQSVSQSATEPHHRPWTPHERHASRRAHPARVPRPASRSPPPPPHRGARGGGGALAICVPIPAKVRVPFPLPLASARASRPPTGTGAPSRI